MKIINTSSNTVIVQSCRIADTFWSRMKGLIGLKYFPEDQGLYITPCNAIHMFFMRFAIDVLFINPSGQVIYLLENFEPWRVSKIIRASVSVLELPAGTIRKKNIQRNDILVIQL